MANLDYGRKMDLEELDKAIHTADTIEQREHYERIAYQIMNESAPLQSLRTELIMAFRRRDIGRVKRIQEHIQLVKLQETNGGSWGSNRGNRKTT